ncbi:hypothetical protein [Enhydrobacter sp.]|uniref:hypothetical protein n=1 Tax=Enhydrobacter sp. TaxID=1894999 RepID=UPI0026278B28|nr:hypothetical protein [Enhydrobacter sp.]WIM11602.1 MAG: hypothetical protein OJF58_002561 [Enhydrobacter sp.]
MMSASKIPMSALCVGAAMLMPGADRSADAAESQWLESGRMSAAEVRALCERVSDVRLLARMQMISTGDARWRQFARQELVIEAVVIGMPPLDPNRCYVLARAGPKDRGERRVFEVLDFAVNPERSSVFIIGRSYDLPPGLVVPRVPCEPPNC